MERRPDPSPLRRRLRRGLRRITAQHLRLEEISDAVVHAIEEADLVTARTSLGRFRAALFAHFSMEQEVDFPALLAVHPELREPVRRLCADHAQLVEDLEAVETLLGRAARADVHRGFDRLVIDLGSHELREERLFDSVT